MNDVEAQTAEVGWVEIFSLWTVHELVFTHPGQNQHSEGVGDWGRGRGPGNITDSQARLRGKLCLRARDGASATETRETPRWERVPFHQRATDRNRKKATDNKRGETAIHKQGYTGTHNSMSAGVGWGCGGA